MFKFKIISITTLLLATLFVGAAEIKLPIKMADVATRLQRNCPDHVKVSVDGDALRISITEAARKGGFDATYAINLKRFAGKNMTIMIDVKLDGLSHGGLRVPGSVGRVFFGGSTQNLVSTHEGWHTYIFKSIKVPGNGLLKMRISLKNLSGEIRVRNPRAKVDLPRTPKKKKKKKK